MNSKPPRWLRAPLVVLLIVACGGEDAAVAPCEINSLSVTLTGTMTNELQTSLALALSELYSDTSVPLDGFEFLGSVLGHGEGTGSATAVFGVTGVQGTLEFQLAGTRSLGSSLDVLGVMPEVMLPGRQPLFSAIPRTGMLMFFATDDFRATTATGHLDVTSVAPLRGTLHAELSDGGAKSRTIDAELAVVPLGPGC